MPRQTSICMRLHEDLLRQIDEMSVSMEDDPDLCPSGNIDRSQALRILLKYAVDNFYKNPPAK